MTVPTEIGCNSWASALDDHFREPRVELLVTRAAYAKFQQMGHKGEIHIAEAFHDGREVEHRFDLGATVAPAELDPRNSSLGNRTSSVQ